MAKQRHKSENKAETCSCCNRNQLKARKYNHRQAMKLAWKSVSEVNSPSRVYLLKCYVGQLKRSVQRNALFSDELSLILSLADKERMAN